jgi:hypothetical protein
VDERDQKIVGEGGEKWIVAQEKKRKLLEQEYR